MFKNLLSKKTELNKPSLSTEEQKVLIEATALGNKIYNWCGQDSIEKISIGQNCNSAWYLKESNNKIASYPFDWIFSSQDIVLHTIKDDFKSFLEKENIFTINKKQAGHSFYHSNMFNHRNPLNSDEEYDYYKRCADRFKSVLHNKKPIIFICTVINEPNKRLSWSNGFNKEIAIPINQSLESFSTLIDFIKNINPNVKFLFINQITEGNLKIESAFFNQEIMWIDFTSKGTNTGVKYLDLIDDIIMKIIYQGLNKNHKQLNE